VLVQAVAVQDVFHGGDFVVGGFYEVGLLVEREGPGARIVFLGDE
jgi:hypothetical protein